jgi:hypothetical protein
MPSALSSSDKPIELAISLPAAQQGLDITASIQWTDFGSRSPRLRGRKFALDGDQVWEWRRRKGWVSLSERQLRRARERYSQL